MSSSEAVRYFDDVAEEYASRYIEPTPGGYALRIRQQRVLEMLDQPGGRVLDLGCGPGVLAQELVDRGYEVWGMDAAPGMIKQSRVGFANADQVQFSIGDAANLAFPDGFFDAVVCVGVIDHTPAHQSAIKEMVRVTKHGGTLLVTFPNLLSPYVIWRSLVFYPSVALLRPAYYYLTRRQRRSSLYGVNQLSTAGAFMAYIARLGRAASFAKQVTAIGAEVTTIVYFYFNMFLSPIDELFPHRTLEWTKRLEQLCSSRAKWLGAGIILKARKR